MAVEFDPQAGGPAKLRNPWSGAGVTLYRNGRRTQDPSGEFTAFPTARGEDIIIVRQGSDISTLIRTT